MAQLDLGIRAYNHDHGYSVRLVYESDDLGARYRLLDGDTSDDAEISGTAAQCLAALDGFVDGGAELSDDGQDRFGMLLAGGRAEELFLQIARLREREGEENLPQQSAYEALDDFECEVLDMLASTEDRAEAWDDLERRLSSWEEVR